MPSLIATEFRHPVPVANLRPPPNTVPVLKFPIPVQNLHVGNLRNNVSQKTLFKIFMMKKKTTK
jgi:hypothetical protein